MRKKILIVSAIYYKDIAKSLKTSAYKRLLITKYKVDEVVVPGVFEIPVIIAKYIIRYDGFLALGGVIKGETPHFNFISQSTIDAIMKLSKDSKKPIGNGIITCLNMKQALARKNKGDEAARAVFKAIASE